MIGPIVYLNGSYVARDDAKVSVFDHGFIYGDGVYEGLQIVEGVIFMLDDHIDRLFNSARYLGFEIPLSRGEVIEAILETARRNDLRNGYLRPLVTRGSGPLGIRNMDKLGPPTVVVITQFESIEERRKAWNRGITAQVVSVRRIPPACLDSRAKSCNYLNNIMAYLEAKAAGADTAIMLDTEGFVAEAYTSNLFCVKDGQVVTPALGSILAGITRRTLLGICKELGIPAREGQVTTYDLYTADEVFECGTMAEVRPLLKVNGRTIAGGEAGPIGARIHQALRKMMESGKHGVDAFAKAPAAAD
jgi:branched-chain amino acid aminotransferase